MSESKSELKTASVSGAVIRLAIPAIAQSFLQTLVFLVDRAMLGHYTTDALASLRLIGPLVWCSTGILSAFTVGAVALVGRAVGMGDRNLAATAARASLLFAGAVGLTTTVLGWLGLDAILGLFPGVDSSVVMAAKSYLQIILLAMPLVLVTTGAASMLQAAGNTRTPFAIALVGNIVNFCLNYLLIFGHFGAPALGVRGAAIGSATAMLVNAAILLLVLARREGVLTLFPEAQKMTTQKFSLESELAALRRILRISWPTFGERLMRSVGYLGFTAIITLLGSVAMATHEALIGLEEGCFQLAEGFGIAVAAIVAQRLGASRPDEAARGAKVGVGCAIALLSLCGVLFLLIPAQLLGLFTPDAQIIATGIPCLYVAAAAQPFMATSIVLEQALRGAGDTRSAFYISLMGWFVVRLIATCIFVFVLQWGLLGVWLGSTCDWVVRSIALVVVFAQERWSKILV